eukprot:5314753-Pyramimonas_sp.AAC.1
MAWFGYHTRGVARNFQSKVIYRPSGAICHACVIALGQLDYSHLSSHTLECGAQDCAQGSAEGSKPALSPSSGSL